jgi:prepilin-type N-terminal cleavage/methylation domain-containing protein
MQYLYLIFERNSEVYVMGEREKKTRNSLIKRTEKPSEGKAVRGSRQKGFTLVELIVVLVILAIVAAIVMPALLGFIDSGKEKEEKIKAQKALAATQTALSDLYNDASSRLDPKKRSKIREIADSDINDGTEFTVWTEKELRDGYTTATAENIASYTVKKALFKANDQLYFYYNGKSWEKLTIRYQMITNVQHMTDMVKTDLKMQDLIQAARSQAALAI